MLQERKKKVLMVSCGGLGRGGVQAVMMTVVRGLREKYSFDMLLFTDEVRAYDEEFLSYGGKILRVPFYEGRNRLYKKMDYYLRGWRIYRKVCRILREQGPYDIIHCNNNFESALCLRAASACGVAVRIVHAHGNLEMGNTVQRVYHTAYQRMIRKYATELVACAPEAATCTFGTLENVNVIFNSYDEYRFRTADHSETSREKMILTQVASYNPNKNQLFSLGIAESLKNAGISVELNLVGFGEYEKVIRDKIAEAKLEDVVVLHPSDADIPSILSKTVFFLLPSVREGFGIVLLEAQAMGVKCYVSDTVPVYANVGGCVYLPLSAGTAYWAEQIRKDYEENKGERLQFDCSSFTTANFLKQIEKIYG